MKNLFFMVIAMMFVLLSASCSKDEPAEPPVIPASFMYNCSVAFEKELLDMVDIAINYTDENGTPKSEAVTTAGEVDTLNNQRPTMVKPSITKTITAARVPYAGGYKFTFKLKKNAPEKPLYTFNVAGTYAYSYQPDAAVPSLQYESVIDGVRYGDMSKEEFVKLLDGLVNDYFSRGYKVENTKLDVSNRWK